MPQFTNLALSPVAVAPGLTGVQLTVEAGKGDWFPLAPFQATIWPKFALPDHANAEIVTVTTRAGDVFTIVRGVEQTAQRDVVVGDWIGATVTKDMLAVAAWTDKANTFQHAQTFAGQVTIQGAAGSMLDFYPLGGPADARRWKIHSYIDGHIYFQPHTDADAVQGSTLVLYRNGDVNVTRTLTVGYASQLRERVTIGTAITGAGAFANTQLEIVGTGHPSLVLTDPNRAVDLRKFRVANHGGKFEIAPVNDAENAYDPGMVPFTIDRVGNVTAMAVTTNTVLVVNLSASNNIYSTGGIQAGGAISAGTTITATGNIQAGGHYLAQDASLGLAMYAGHVQFFHDTFYWTNKANTGHRMLLDSANTLSVYGAIIASTTIYASGNINSAADIGASSVVATHVRALGSMTSDYGLTAGSISTGGVTCTAINVQGGDIQTGYMTCATQARIGGVLYCNDNATYQGYPWIRGAAGAHMVLNGNPLYLNLDWAGSVLIHGAGCTIYPTLSCNAINCTNINTQGYNVTTATLNVSGQSWVGALHNYGGMFTTSTATFNAVLQPSVDAAINLGDALLRWAGIALALQPTASGPTIVTSSLGWLFYLSSERETKRDIEPLTLEHAQAVVEKLVPYRYRDIKDESNGPKVVGFMVEDAMASGNEELVSYYNHKPASIQYERIGVYLSMVVKDMQRQIAELELQIANLKRSH